MYGKVFLLTGGVFIIGLAAPYAKGIFWAIILLVLLALALIVNALYLINTAHKLLKFNFNSFQDIKFLFIIMAFLYSAVYFYISVFDAEGSLISGLRQIEYYSYYEFYSLDGFLEYFQDMLFTYLNSLYYSVVVMATLGDSGVVVEHTVVRMLVASQVLILFSLTIFKIVEFYSENSYLETNRLEKNILRNIKDIKLCYNLDANSGFFEKVFFRLACKAQERRKRRI
jgi:hypothetical protein|tara:strand:- start:1022 stop:1702 length:681 start_codon:yes stop_codon:yes gene_type:complete